MASQSERQEQTDARLGALPARAPERRSPAVQEISPANKRRQIAEPVKSRREAEASVYSLVGSEWFYAAPAMIIAMLIAAAISKSLPGPQSAAAAGLAILMVAASRFLLPLEARYAKSPFQRYVVMVLLVGAPMLLFGISMTGWIASAASMTAILAICGVRITGTLAVTALHGRLPAIIVAITSLWLGMGWLSDPATSLFALMACLAGGLFLAFKHSDRIAGQEARRIDEERRSYRAEKLLSEYEQTGQGWFWETDRRGMITYVSPRIAKLLGGDNEATVGKPFTSMFILDSQEKESERTLIFHLSTRSSFQELAVLAATGEEEERWWSITGRPVLDKFNNFLGFRGSGIDLTDKRRSDRHVTELARFDSLTKLANRFQMAEWLEKILDAPQEERRACAVFLLDLDRFKQVNDTMGHPAGDALLRQVADRLRSTVGKAGSVGRLGGDEFQVILPGRQKREDLAHMARRIIENLSQPYSIDGARVIIGASIGISVCPDNGANSEELIRNADLALYAAKDSGRGRHHFYAADLHSEAEERRQLEQDLRDAITNGDLELHYQPQVSTMTEKISGFEALLRWKHPKLGYLSPSKFIPIAEDAGLINQIGEWALRTACDQLAKWPDTVRVAVNVSPLQFANPALPSIVTNAIANAGIVPARLELEITESVFLNDDKSTEAMFAMLKGVGVRLALDDFGTGYSSLGYLKTAPFDKIKIDQSFVSGATVAGNRNGAIIASIVNLAESLHMETTAEGVETLDELDLIRTLGCSHIQGFIYEKAITAEVATERLQTGLTVIARGPRSARAPRQTMLRKVLLENGGHRYNGTIRNISTTGALIEGLWNVPPATEFNLHLAHDYIIRATARWCKEDRMGVEFAQPLGLDENGGVSVAPPRRNASEPGLLRKAG